MMPPIRPGCHDHGFEPSASTALEADPFDERWARRMAGLVAHVAAVVARGEAALLDPGSTVEYAAGRMAIADIGDAADHLSPEFRAGIPGIPWEALAAARDQCLGRVGRSVLWAMLLDVSGWANLVQPHLADEA